MPPASSVAGGRAAAPEAGRGSPSMTLSMASTPALMPPAKSPCLKSGRDDVADDALADEVGERAFQAVADFDAHGPILLGDQQDGAVVDLFAARASRLSATRMEYCSMASGCGGGHDEDGHLAALFGLEGARAGLQFADPRPGRGCRSGPRRGR